MSNDSFLFWETKSDGSVSLSPSTTVINNKLRSSLLLCDNLLVRPAELIEGNLMFKSALSGELRAFLDEGLIRLALPEGGSLRSQAEWAYLNPLSSKDFVSFNGETWAKHNVPTRIRKLTEQRVKALEQAGWETRPSYFANSIYVDRVFRYRLLLKRLYLDFPSKEMRRFAELDTHIANRGELYARAEKDWIKDLPSGSRDSFLSSLQDELTNESVLILANSLESGVSWLKPQTWLRRKYGPLGRNQILVNKAIVLGTWGLAKILQKRQYPLLSELLDSRITDAARFTKWYTSNKKELKHDQNDLQNLLFGPTKRLAKTNSTTTLAAELIDQQNGRLVDTSVAEQYVIARLNEYEEEIKRKATIEALGRVAINAGIGLTLTFFESGVGTAYSITSALLDIDNILRSRRGVFACYRH